MQKEGSMEETPSPEPKRSADPPSNPRRKRSIIQRLIVWLLILLGFAGLFAWVLSRKSTPAAAAPSGRRAALTGINISVVPAVAKKGSIGVYLEAIGTVTPVYTSSVTSQVTGLVMEVHYTEGQLVQKGDPLIDIDPRPFQAQLAQAQGTLIKDQHVLEQAKMDLDRYREAWSRNAIAKQILDDQEKAVLQDEGTVKADEGLVQYDQVQLAYCHITATFSGRVGLRLIDPGNVVQANSSTPLVVITQEQPITVIFTLSQNALGQIQPQVRRGRTLRVEAYDPLAKTKIATGKLLTIDNQIDTATGTVKLRAIFDNKNDELFPNQFVNTRLLVDTLNNMTLIPTSAIQHNGQVAFVYLIQNGTAEMRDVTPGATEGNMTAVEGINPGDVVANSSFEKLQPNAKVVLAKQAPPSDNSVRSAP
jgi:multidrug efflux system membrane fusion protein